LARGDAAALRGFLRGHRHEFLMKGLAAGPYVIRIRLEGYATREIRVAIREREPTRLEIDLDAVDAGMP